MKKEIIIDGVTYVLKNESVTNLDGLKCVLIRGDRSGVHFGYLKSKDGTEVVLLNAKRVFYWSGACSLSQLSVDGVDENNSKISIAVDEIIITDVIEIINLTEKALTSLNLKTWEK